MSWTKEEIEETNKELERVNLMFIGMVEDTRIDKPGTYNTLLNLWKECLDNCKLKQLLAKKNRELEAIKNKVTRATLEQNVIEWSLKYAESNFYVHDFLIACKKLQDFKNECGGI